MWLERQLNVSRVQCLQSPHLQVQLDRQQNTKRQSERSITWSAREQKRDIRRGAAASVVAGAARLVNGDGDDLHKHPVANISDDVVENIEGQ